MKKLQKKLLLREKSLEFTKNLKECYHMVSFYIVSTYRPKIWYIPNWGQKALESSADTIIYIQKHVYWVLLTQQ